MGQPYLVGRLIVCCNFGSLLTVPREAVNRPAALPESSITRSPTGSIRTILSVDSRSSDRSNGTRSTVFVPPLSSLDEISDFQSNMSRSEGGVSRQGSLVSSHHGRIVDDTVIRDQEYIYPGDPRAIAPSRKRSLRRTGSTTDLDDEFAASRRRSRPGRSHAQGGSPRINSKSTLQSEYAVAPNGKNSKRSSANLSGSEAFLTAPGTRSSGVSSHGRSSSRSGSGLPSQSQSYTSSGVMLTSSGLRTDETVLGITSVSSTDFGGSQDNSATTYNTTSLARTRGVRRRNGTSPRDSRSYTSESASESLTDSRDLTTSSLTPEERSFTAHSRSITDSGSYSPAGYSRSSVVYSSSSSGSRPPPSSSNPDRSSGVYSSSSSSGHPGSGGYPQSFTASNGFSVRAMNYTSSGDFTSTGFTGSGAFTTSSGEYTSDALRGSGSETGYDICQSSDISELLPPVYATDSTVTPTPPSASVAESAVSDYISDAGKLAISPISTDYLSVKTPSTVASFKSLPSARSASEYNSVTSGTSQYRTSSEKATERSASPYQPKALTEPRTEYITANIYSPTPSSRSPLSSRLSEPELQPETPESPEALETLEEPAIPPASPATEPDSIPSEPSTPRPASVIHPVEELDEYEDEDEVEGILQPEEEWEEEAEIVDVLEPEGSVVVPTPSEVDTIPSPVSSMVSLTEDVPPSPLEVAPRASIMSISATPSPLTSSASSISSAPTPSSVSRRLATRSLVTTSSSSIPPMVDSTTSSSTSDLTPTTLTISSDRTPYSRPIQPPAPYGPPSYGGSSITSSLGGFSFTPGTESGSGSLPPLTPAWAQETNGSFDTSILNPSPTVASYALGDPPDHSFETSNLRPTSVASVPSSRVDVPTPVTSAAMSLPPVVPVMAPHPRPQPVPQSRPRPQSVVQPRPQPGPPPPPAPYRTAPPPPRHEPVRRLPAVEPPRALPPPPQPSQYLAPPSSLSSSTITSSSSSSLGRTISNSSTVSTSSIRSQRSLSARLLSPSAESIDLPLDDDPSTEPSLLATPRSSLRGSVVHRQRPASVSSASVRKSLGSTLSHY